jgi:hypothetical protein
VKNKWYLRRHNVSHHGAPLKKFRKGRGNKHAESD